MNCKFCNNAMKTYNPEKPTNWYCEKCPIYIEYHFYYDIDSYLQLEYYIFYVKNYLLSFEILDNKFNFFKNKTLLFSLNYIPDIKPADSQDFVNKVMKMKPFI